MLSWYFHVQDQSAEADFGEVSFGEGSIQCWWPSEVYLIGLHQAKAVFLQVRLKHRLDLLAVKLLS